MLLLICLSRISQPSWIGLSSIGTKPTSQDVLIVFRPIHWTLSTEIKYQSLGRLGPDSPRFKCRLRAFCTQPCKGHLHLVHLLGWSSDVLKHKSALNENVLNWMEQRTRRFSEWDVLWGEIFDMIEVAIKGVAAALGWPGHQTQFTALHLQSFTLPGFTLQCFSLQCYNAFSQIFGPNKYFLRMVHISVKILEFVLYGWGWLW